MCGGGGSGSKDDNIEKVVAPVANFKPNDNPMTGYKPGDIRQERLDPIGNPTEAPKNYPGTNIVQGTTNLNYAPDDRDETFRSGNTTPRPDNNKLGKAIVEQGFRTATYMANPMLGVGVDVARGVINFLSPNNKFGTTPQETALNVLTGPIGGKRAGATAMQDVLGKVALGADLAYGASRAREVGMAKAMQESPRFSQQFVGQFFDDKPTNTNTGTTKSKDIGTIGTNNIIGTTKNDINFGGFDDRDDKKRRQGFGKGVYTRF